MYFLDNSVLNIFHFPFVPINLPLALQTHSLSSLSTLLSAPQADVSSVFQLSLSEPSEMLPPGLQSSFCPKENLTHNSQVVHLFLVDNANRLLCHLISIWDDGQTHTSIKSTTKYGYLSILSANFECFLYF